MAEIEKLFVSIWADVKGFVTGMATVKAQTSGLAASMSSLGSTMTKFVTIPLLGIGAAALGSAITVEHGLNQIRKITGATGDDFESMGDTMRNIAKTSAKGFEDIGAAVGEVHARTGLMGEGLENLTRKFLKFAKVTQTDFNEVIEKSTQIFNQWGIAAENQAESLEWLYKVTAETGVTFSTLGESMVTSAAQLQAMGFDFKQASALIGQFEKMGVNTSQAMMGLKIALKNMAKEGVTDASEAFKILIDRIKNAPTDMDAFNEAVAIFGARGAAEMTKAIRDGNFALEDLMTTLGESDTSIDATAEQTKTLGERFANLKNQAVLALEPVGTDLMDAVEEHGIPALKKLAGAVTTVIDEFEKLPDSVQSGILAVAGIALMAGPLLKVAVWAGGIGTAFMAMAATVGTSCALAAASVGTFVATSIAWLEGLAASAGAAGVAFGLLEGVVLAVTGVVGYKMGEKIAKDLFVPMIEGSTRSQAALESNMNTLEQFGGSIYDLGKTMSELGYVGEQSQYQLNEAFAAIKDSGTDAAASLALVPDQIIIALNSKVGYLRDAGEWGIENYIDGFVSQTGRSQQEATEISNVIKAGLSSQDPAIRANAQGMMETILDELVSGGKLTQDQANAIAQGIKDAMNIEAPHLHSSWTDWSNSLIGLFGDVETAANNARNAIAGVGKTTPTGRGGSYTETGETEGNALGGLITRPTLTWVGEKGPELIVPLTGPNAGKGLSASNAMSTGGISFYGDINLPGIRDSNEFAAWANRQAQQIKMREAVSG